MMFIDNLEVSSVLRRDFFERKVKNIFKHIHWILYENMLNFDKTHDRSENEN